MLRMVPSILLKSPQNSALTTRSASMGKTAEDRGITHQINGVHLSLIYCLLRLIRADSEKKAATYSTGVYAPGLFGSFRFFKRVHLSCKIKHNAPT